MRIVIDLAVYTIIVVQLCAAGYYFSNSANFEGIVFVASAFGTGWMLTYYTKVRPLARARFEFTGALFDHKFGLASADRAMKNWAVSVLKSFHHFGDIRVDISRLYAFPSSSLIAIAGEYCATGEGWNYGFFILLCGEDFDGTLFDKLDDFFTANGFVGSFGGLSIIAYKTVNARLIDMPAHLITHDRFKRDIGVLVSQITHFVNDNDREDCGEVAS